MAYTSLLTLLPVTGLRIPASLFLICDLCCSLQNIYRFSLEAGFLNCVRERSARECEYGSDILLRSIKGNVFIIRTSKSRPL